MKLFCQLLIAYCLLAVIVSCKQKIDYTKDISRLDSASAVLMSTEKILLAVDTSALHNTYKTSSEDLRGLSKDTVKKNTAPLLSVTNEQIGNIRNLLENKKYLERAVTESKKRISDLKHDLAENLIEKNKADGYIVNEINSSGKICDAVNRSVEKARTASSKLDSLKPQIEQLTDSLHRLHWKKCPVQ